MSKLGLFSILTAGLALAATSASAAGGMGDPSVLLKQKNAICDLQRHGEGPRQPDMCLPEYPLDSDRSAAEKRW